MPTVNPRINVTLSPSLFGMVDELAKHQRVSNPWFCESCWKPQSLP